MKMKTDEAIINLIKSLERRVDDLEDEVFKIKKITE